MGRKKWGFLMVIVFLTEGTYGLSRAQLKKSSQMFKKKCMTKENVTEDQIGEIDKGKFIEEKPVMCYIACVYQMAQVTIVLFMGAISVGLELVRQSFVFFISRKFGLAWTNAGIFGTVFCLVKNNKLSYEASIKQVDLMYPPEMKEGAKQTIEKCKDVSKKYKDLCEASYWTAKCMYEDDPKNFVFA